MSQCTRTGTTFTGFFIPSHVHEAHFKPLRARTLARSKHKQHKAHVCMGCSTACVSADRDRAHVYVYVGLFVCTPRNPLGSVASRVL